LLLGLKEGGVVDLSLTARYLDGGQNVMEHLVVDDVGDEVEGDMGLVEAAVDLDLFSDLVVGAKRHGAPRLGIPVPYPADFEIELALEILGVDLVENLPKIEVFPLMRKNSLPRLSRLLE